VPLGNGRALIAFDEPMTAARLELLIQDELDDHDLPDEDARVFEHVRDLLRGARRSKAITLRQQNIIVLEHAGRTGGGKGTGTRKRKEIE
jgi:hypothetical protein